LNEDFEARLTDAKQQLRRFRSKHVYSLEEFGLSRGWIQQHLRPVLDFYGFPR
jgi:hypothetical protein